MLNKLNLRTLFLRCFIYTICTFVMYEIKFFESILRSTQEQKIKYLINIPIWGKLYHNLQLFHLDINWVIVLAKEDLFPDILLSYRTRYVMINTNNNSERHKCITLISCASIVGLFWTIRLMFLSATYWISGSADRSVTRGGAIFLQRFRTTSVLVMSSICRRIIYVEEITQKLNLTKRNRTFAERKNKQQLLLPWIVA
jgi:hypothetical protein